MADSEVTATQGEPQGEAVLNPAIEDQKPGTDQTQNETEGTSGPETASTDQDADGGKAKTPAWAQRRIDELTAKFRAAEREKDAKAREADVYREMFAAQNRGDAPAEQPTQQPADIDALATAKAQEIVKAQTFNTACNDVYEKGSKSFPDFGEAIQNLNLIGAMERDFIETVLETEAPHKVLRELGKNPDEASRILALSPAKQAIALDRLAREAPAAKPVSNAPPPIKPITGSSRGEPDPEKMTDTEWMVWRRKQTG